VTRDPASFRDPSGHIHHRHGRILRTVTATAAPHYEHVRNAGLLRRWMERGWLIRTEEIREETGGEERDEEETGDQEGGYRRSGDQEILGGENIRGLWTSDVRYVLEHERIPFISYPYEWPFGALKAAALLHLELQLDALAHGVQLSDASAYNVQFDGARPVFIDLLSFRRYTEGDYWLGHRQFCEQFLNPLLLRALVGVPHNPWFRGALEGITGEELSALLPARRKVSLNVLSHVTLPARMTARARGRNTRAARPRRPLPRSAYRGLLAQLRAWIARLEPRDQRATTWSDYETTHTYGSEEEQRKRTVVAEFVRQVRPALLFDVGCNTGNYSALALESGAERVVGFEADQGALDRAFARATERRLAFLPLYTDAANPSPDQGWRQAERRGLGARGPANALLALAFTHHLAIGRNVPLDDVAAWLVSLAPRGVVEFVPKADPTVQLMLSTREDIFTGYSADAFTRAFERHARIVRAETISASGRRLFVYDTSR
jgi:ribosomal protein L11 methylase PrmA